jgi:hypothetical protein
LFAAMASFIYIFLVVFLVSMAAMAMAKPFDGTYLATNIKTQY